MNQQEIIKLIDAAPVTKRAVADNENIFELSVVVGHKAGREFTYSAINPNGLPWFILRCSGFGFMQLPALFGELNGMGVGSFNGWLTCAKFKEICKKHLIKTLKTLPAMTLQGIDVWLQHLVDCNGPERVLKFLKSHQYTALPD